MSFSVNYLVFCVPTLHINNYRNRDIVLNALITEFITLGVKHHMSGKVPKSKDFYKVSLCSNTTVSTWLESVVLIAILEPKSSLLQVTSPPNSLNLHEQVNTKLPRKCLYFSK